MPLLVLREVDKRIISLLRPATQACTGRSGRGANCPRRCRRLKIHTLGVKFFTRPLGRAGLHEMERPWLNPHATISPAAADPPEKPARKRPLMFVHELPADYNTRMLQYRVQHKACVHR